jgi:hypothetical protein
MPFRKLGKCYSACLIRAFLQNLQSRIAARGGSPPVRRGTVKELAPALAKPARLHLLSSGSDADACFFQSNMGQKYNRNTIDVMHG